MTDVICCLRLSGSHDQILQLLYAVHVCLNHGKRMFNSVSFAGFGCKHKISRYASYPAKL